MGRPSGPLLHLRPAKPWQMNGSALTLPAWVFNSLIVLVLGGMRRLYVNAAWSLNLLLQFRCYFVDALSCYLAWVEFEGVCCTSFVYIEKWFD